MPPGCRHALEAFAKDIATASSGTSAALRAEAATPSTRVRLGQLVNVAFLLQRGAAYLLSLADNVQAVLGSAETSPTAWCRLGRRSRGRRRQALSLLAGAGKAVAMDDHANIFRLLLGILARAGSRQAAAFARLRTDVFTPAAILGCISGILAWQQQQQQLEQQQRTGSPGTVAIQVLCDCQARGLRMHCSECSCLVLCRPHVTCGRRGCHCM